MAATIATATGYDKSHRVKEVHRLGSHSASGEAATWRTFAQAVVRADGSGYVRVERKDERGFCETIHEFAFGPENETKATSGVAAPLESVLAEF